MSSVTVAIPYYGAAEYIEQAVRSALGQTHKDLRVVVVGDGERPSIPFEDPRLAVHTLARNHGGAPFAQQVALLATPDEWYAPMGADDWLEPDHIERLLAVGAPAVATGRVFWHEQREAGGPVRGVGARRVWYETGLFRADLLRSIGGYDPRERSGQDNCLLWLLEVYGGLVVRSGLPTYHRLKRYQGSVSVDVHGTTERRESDARTDALVEAARGGATIDQTRRRRSPGRELGTELAQEVAALKRRIKRMEPSIGIDALIVSGVWDPAGIGARYALASRPGLSIRAAHRQTTYLSYPRDILWDQETDSLVRQLATRADVVHVDVNPGAYSSLGLERFAKAAVLEHHGSAFRSASAVLQAQAARLGMVQAVSTIDLLRLGDDLTWLPAPYRVANLGVLADEGRRPPDGRVRVVQTPTSRKIKSTARLEAAVRSLQHEGLPVELVIGEKVSWSESLRLKATADVFFDQVQLGYGCSAIEAMGMGIPVIAGGDGWTEARMREEFGGDLPYYRAEDTEESIASAIRALAASMDLRAEYGARGLAHALRFHDEGPALDRLEVLYRRALDPENRPARSLGRPGLFRNTKYPALRLDLDGSSFKFVGGRLRVGDGDRADLVRIHALASPRTGITEEAWEG